MKFAILVALCAVCCLELVNGSLTGFQTAEIGVVADRLVEGTTKIKNGLTAYVQQIGNPAIIAKGLQTFEDLVINLMVYKPECVKEEMRSAAPDAVSRLQHCLMDPATAQAKTEEGEKKLENLINKLRSVDSELLQVTDPVIKAEKFALAEIDLVGGFFLEMTHDIVNAMGPLMTCTQHEATNLRDKILSYIDDASKCKA